MYGKRIMIDVLTPKQALLFGKVKEKLERRKCSVYLTSRRYVELTNIFKISRIKPVIIGKHGGADLYNKLVSSLSRAVRLSKFMKKVFPDLVLSFSSPEATRAAFGLNIPHVSVNDSPHSTHIARLTIPLSHKLLTPQIIGKKIWLKYGISRENIICYKSLDPVAWLKDFTPNRAVLRRYDLPLGEYMVYRPEEYRASYLNVGQLTLERVLDAYHKECSSTGIKLVIVPRYEEETYKKIARRLRSIVILKHGEDTRSMMFYSRGFIGGGGTMNAEAVLMGIPTISVHPSSTIIEKYLLKRGMLVKLRSDEDFRSWLRKILLKEFNEDERSLALAKLREMEDPAEKIAETCLGLL